MKCKFTNDVSLEENLYFGPSGTKYLISKKYWTEVKKEDVEYFKGMSIIWQGEEKAKAVKKAVSSPVTKAKEVVNKLKK